jgi:cytochrome c2
MKRVLLMILLVGCKRAEAPVPVVGDVERGRQLAAQYACSVCHKIPGTQGPQGVLGPALTGVASRPVISLGAVENTPENMARFIRNAPGMNPNTSMPPVPMSDADARDLVAFLMTLK